MPFFHCLWIMSVNIVHGYWLWILIVTIVCGHCLWLWTNRSLDSMTTNSLSSAVLDSRGPLQYDNERNSNPLGGTNNGALGGKNQREHPMQCVITYSVWFNILPRSTVIQYTVIRYISSFFPPISFVYTSSLLSLTNRTMLTTEDDDATPNPWGDEDQTWALQEYVAKYKAQFDSVQKNGMVVSVKTLSHTPISTAPYTLINTSSHTSINTPSYTPINTPSHTPIKNPLIFSHSTRDGNRSRGKTNSHRDRASNRQIA